MKVSYYYAVVENLQCMFLYSTLYRLAVKIHDEEIKNFFRTIKPGDKIPDVKIGEFEDFFNDLKSARLLIEDNVDEVEFINLLNQRKLVDDSSLELIIIPTRQCNFRCPYCYEEHENKIMIQDTYSNILNFVQTYVKNKTPKSIRISWFGGEPLLEYKSICDFMDKLIALVGDNCEIYGSITTNAYLLTEKVFSKLIKSKVTSYQITVDGPKEYHNKTRFLPGGFGTWDRIIKNLMFAANSDYSFNINIRTNFTENLMNIYIEWLDFLNSTFSNDKRFQFHWETVKDLGGRDTSLAYNLEKEDPIKNVLSYAKVLKMNSPNDESSLRNLGFTCYAGRLNSLVIDWDGTIKKCTVALEEEKNHIGCLTNKGMELDYHKLAWWTNYNHKEECKKCFIYPTCYAKKCPVSYYSESSCKMFKDYQLGLITSILQDL